jgi:hypothetical protein
MPRVEIRQIIQQLTTDITTIATGLPRAHQRAAEQSGGYPTAGNSRGPSGGHTDRTAAIALRGEPLDQETRHIETQLTQLAQTARQLAQITIRLTTTHPTTQPDPECAPCRQHTNTHRPVYQTLTIPLPNNKTKRLPVCSWHADRWHDLGIIAGPDSTRLHHQGKTMRSNTMRATIAKEHPNEWATHTQKTKETTC